MVFPRQEYWSGLPFPSPRVFLTQELNPGSLALQADFLPSGLPSIAQLVKNPPTIQETLVQFLGQADLLEKG